MRRPLVCWFRSFALVTCLLTLGCGQPKPGVTGSSPEPKAARPDPWILGRGRDQTELTWLSNGRLGIRFGGGWQLDTEEIYTDAEYEPSGEEKIRKTVSREGKANLSGPTFVSQTLDMRTGLVETIYRERSDENFQRVVLHPDKRIVGFSDNWEWENAGDLLGPEKGGGLPFETVKREAEAYWRKAWETDIEIDGPVEDQQAIRSFMFYLRMAMHPKGSMSVAPYALSNTTYNGHVFWDADTWVFPAMVFVDPDRAKIIPEYRQRLTTQAMKNFGEWLDQGRPTGKENLGRPELEKMDISPGAKFPWESSISGKETVPGPSKFQDHITGSVAWSYRMARALALTSPRHDLVTLAGQYYSWRSEVGQIGREIKGTMSPDEFHIGDNDLYTNLLAEWCVNGGKFAPAVSPPLTPSPRTNIVERGFTRFKLPRDEKSFLTYDGDPVRGYKQAAAVLAIYPLQYPPAEKQALTMLDRFEGKVTKNGPAMSDSIHALIRARFGDAGEAYKTWHESWKPFTDHAFMLFSEKRSKDSTYFVTGAAGSLQSVIYGFLGFRIDYQKEPGAVWTKQLKGGYWLSIKPNLPPAWKKVTFKNFHVLGKRYTLTATHDSATVTEGAP